MVEERLPAGGGHRLAYLDALRGIAAFAVVWQHAAEVVWRQTPHGSVMWRIVDRQVTLINLGRFGVILFFLLSGFVIPFSFTRGIRSFLLSRFFRLYPAFWLCILIGCLLGPIPGQPAWTAGQIAVNATMAQHWLHVPNLYGQFWTLSFELLFYGLCVALFAVGRLHSAAVIGGGTVALFLIGCLPQLLGEIAGGPARPPHDAITLPAYLLLGTLLRLAVLENDPLARRLAAPAVVLACCSSIILNAAPSPYRLAPYEAGLPEGVACLAAVLVFLLILRWRPAPALLVRAGAISYSAYLFQATVFTLLMPVDACATTGSALLFLVASVVGTAAIASLTFRLVERPAMALGHRLMRSRRPTGPEAEGAWTYPRGTIAQEGASGAEL